MKTLTAQQWAMCIGRKIEFQFGIPIFLETLRGIEKYNEHIGLYVTQENFFSDKFLIGDRHCKPILRELSQMTEEQKEEFKELFCTRNFYDVEINNQRITYITKEPGDIERKSVYDQIASIDWLRQKGFCLNPEWFEDGLAIKYDPEKHGEW